ncbi:spermidine synthase [Asanoa ishikariensis]|uniref:Spermine/spermidine synthase n=1 Tax=Asanoa ishikariensis TaxID=137265 RepID=A0A1H3S4I9_9ACTN|nr:spermidine synthase [Asanoa ishikariensis]GIF66540.1 spermidine synthase [Asanoa ishikariensis]SDZ32401.1 Spermine/spermidine synthase [Asanoa ishikariensis]
METVERVVTDRGELVLRRDGAHFELISNGVFLMDTRSGTSERTLVRAALSAAAPGARLLIGGLGVGFSLAEAVRSKTAAEIVVIEIEPDVVAWHATHLASFSAGALDDPRVRVVTADLGRWLATTDELFDVICLDVDNGPDWTVFGDNAALYGDAGTALLRAHLSPGGVLAVWSASASAAYLTRLTATIGPVETLLTEVDRGEPDVVYLARRCS